MIEGPVPAVVPPQEPVYHFQEAPVPKLPPFTLSMVDPPGQKSLAEAEAEEGAVETVLTVTCTEAHSVVLQSPSALA